MSRIGDPMAPMIQLRSATIEVSAGERGGPRSPPLRYIACRSRRSAAARPATPHPGTCLGPRTRPDTSRRFPRPGNTRRNVRTGHDCHGIRQVEGRG
eukprot:1380287-Rhodomonas_salina.3